MRIFERWMFSLLLLLPLHAPAAAPGLPSIDDPVRTGRRAPNDAGLVIGIETYLRTGVPPVPYAKRDAQAFYDFLVSTRGIPADRVRLVQDNASAALVRREVTELGKEVGADGVAWVYFAGHGAAALAGAERMLLGDDVMNDPREFDNGGVRLTEIEHLAGAGGGRVVMVVDACDTGVAGRDLVPGYFTPGATKTVLWSAAGPGQVAGPLDAAGHGAFTYFALGALRGWADGEADGVSDGRVTAGEAQLYVSRALRAAQLTAQTPAITGEQAFVMDYGAEEEKPEIPLLGELEAKPAQTDATQPKPSQPPNPMPAVTPGTLARWSFSEPVPEGWATARGEWVTMDGRLAQNSQEQPARILAGSDSWTDYAIDFDAQKIDGAEGFFVDLRATDKGGGLQWVLGGWGNQFAKLEVIDNLAGGSGHPLESTSRPLVIQAGRTYHVRIEARGAHVTGWLDGTKLLDVTDPEIAQRPSGRIGFATWQTRALFDNVVVTALPPSTVASTQPEPQRTAATLDLSDFTDSTLASWTPSTGRWVWMDGRMAQNGWDAPAHTYSGSENWSDYAIDFDTQKIDGSDAILVDFRTTEQHGMLQWALGGWGNSYAKIQVFDSRGGSHDLETTAKPLALQAGRIYHVRLEVQGAHATGWIDGAKLLDVSDPEIALRPTGRIGLGTWATRAWFDNVVVTQL